MRSKALILILFAVIQTSFVYAYPITDTTDKKLYDRARKTPADISVDLEKLVDYLKQPASSQREIVKAFSYWIMLNISYDISGFLQDVYNTDGINGTLRTKKGVCQDYSELFKAMCDVAGIKCYVIKGYAKAFNYRPGEAFSKANHAWNIVWLDSQYHLMDLTWSSGYIRYETDGWHYYMQPDTSQVFVSPEAFVEKHLPSDPQWQLLTHPIPMNAFTRTDSYSAMLHDTLKYYNYADSIARFEKLDKDAQELKEADNAYSFYPALGDYAYHYYNLAVTCSNAAIDQYNAAVTSYNKSIEDSGAPVASGDYNKTVVSTALTNYQKAIKLLSRISSYSDNQISPSALLGKCMMGLEATTELMKTLR
ncbi:transglutaminase domain-containing protein [Mucilaginibacter sp.]|jgi:transglutaminase/protease-like cytokinesis protein 3|uniref:transglutaminase domain-containing protein n=1 Tax=Mucilaginibacter sp. TaxID=1882438 RepID=UPI002BD0D9F8|nr:transglutaminase domain-containing protein [Mucilaginibacter sp.]HTI59920.1 transglutaminase domain-containing protein [Mucilaginibacter sp.]